MPATAEQQVQFPAKTRFLFEPHRYKVLHGGRGSTKSWSIARALLLMGANKPLRILCAREIQRSIADSVLRLLADQIEFLGLQNVYEVQRSYIRSKINGTLFLFEGLRSNVTKIKSLEGIDVCWVEEAEAISEESWDVLIPTIRKSGSEIWISFNPDLMEDPTYQRFVVNPPPSAKVVALNFADNPWFAESELAAEEVYMRRVDPERHSWIWLGQPRKHNDAQVLKGKWRADSLDTAGADGPYFGEDWGFSTDPTALVRCWLFPASVPGRYKLYIDAERYKVGVPVVDLPPFMRSMPLITGHTVRADNARPELVHHCNNDRGPDGKEPPLKVESVQKWPGSVEDGVDWLRGCEEIIIHPSCKHTIEEARLWSYKTDRLTGDILPDLVDKHNHCWDAVRYALASFIRGSRKSAIIAPSGTTSQSTWGV